MIIRKKNTESFYSELRSLIPEIEGLDVWSDFDAEGAKSMIGAKIFDEIAKLTIEWVSNKKLNLVRRLFEFFELSYNEFEDGANAYIYTDFHPTIIASKDSIIRKKIKEYMGPITKSRYDQLIDLGFYSESKM